MDEDERDPEDDLNKPKDDDEEEKCMKKLKQEAGAQDSEDPKTSAKKSNNNQENNEPKRETNPDELVSTAGASQRAESFFATDLSKLKAEEAEMSSALVTSRDEVEKDLARFKEMCSQQLQQQEEQQSSGLLEHECLKLWLEYESITNQLSKELCEQLRLILEPTVCSKLRGKKFYLKHLFQKIISN